MMRRGPHLWLGLTLILIGTVFLLRRIEAFADLDLWPMVLIAVGLFLLVTTGLRPNPGAWMAPFVLIAIGTVFLLRDLDVFPEDLPIWPVVLIAIGASFLIPAVVPRRDGPAKISEPVRDARRAAVKVTFGAGRLTVGALPASERALFRGEVDARATVRTRRHGDAAEIAIDQRGWATFGWGGRGREWVLDLNPGLPLSLDVRSGASRADLDLSGLQVESLHVGTGASEVTVVMPEQGVTRAEIEAGAASVTMRIPQGVAAAIRTESALASVDIDTLRFPGSGGEYRSPDYETATNRVDLTVKGGVGSFRVR